MTFHNNPQLQDEHGSGKIKKYVHQPITIDHFGMQASIKENGKVVIRSAPKPIAGSKDEMEYDEISIPAGLIFKLAMFLKATRRIEYVSVAEVHPGDSIADGD